MTLTRLPAAATLPSAFLACLAPIALAQTTISLPAAADATLYESATGSLAGGSGPFSFAGATIVPEFRRTLIRFDLTSLPAGAIIQSASLTLHVSRSASASEPFALHRLTASWSEGPSIPTGEGGRGTSAQLGDTTWLHRSYHPDPALQTLWSTPGGDFLPDPSATTNAPGLGPVTWSDPGLLTDLSLWLADPTSNHGWMILGPESLPSTAKRMASREHPDLTLHPTLAITFIPTPATIALIGVSLLTHSWWARRRDRL